MIIENRNLELVSNRKFSVRNEGGEAEYNCSKRIRMGQRWRKLYTLVEGGGWRVKDGGWRVSY